MYFLDSCILKKRKKYACIIFETLTMSMKEWGLDFDKCVGFGSDGASTMIDKQNGVVTRLKDKVNYFLTSIHCVAHMINLAAIDATKVGPCKVMSKEIDDFLNLVAMHFKKSCKRKNALLRLQEELADSTKCLKRYHKIRWLSRWQAVTTLCDSLESVLIYFRDNQDMEDGVGSNIFKKFRTFKYIYVLYFLADILHIFYQCYHVCFKINL